MMSGSTFNAYYACLQIDIFVQVLQADGGKCTTFQICEAPVSNLYAPLESVYYLF